MAQRQYEIQKGKQEPVAYAVSTNPDIMYLHEAMKAPDRDQFKKAMDKVTRFYRCLGYVLVVLNLSVPKIIIS